MFFPIYWNLKLSYNSSKYNMPGQISHVCIFSSHLLHRNITCTTWTVFPQMSSLMCVVWTYLVLLSQSLCAQRPPAQCSAHRSQMCLLTFSEKTQLWKNIIKHLFLYIYIDIYCVTERMCSKRYLSLSRSQCFPTYSFHPWCLSMQLQYLIWNPRFKVSQ